MLEHSLPFHFYLQKVGWCIFIYLNTSFLKYMEDYSMDVVGKVRKWWLGIGRMHPVEDVS